MTTAIEKNFPNVEISKVAEHESWRKEINRPIYHIHKWWATRLGSVFRAITLAAISPPTTDIWSEFYKHHNLYDKVVLDPFMGSGTTLGEALKLGAKAVGCDINPVSSFLVRQAFTRVTESDLNAAFVQLEATVAREIRHYYQTRDPISGEYIPALYFFWVKTVSTPEGEKIPLFSRYVFSQNAYPKKKPLAQIVCANCWSIYEDNYNVTLSQCPECSHQFNPQVGPAKGQHVTDSNGVSFRIKDLLINGSAPEHRLFAIMALRPNGDKVYLPAKEEDNSLFLEAESRLNTEELHLPTMSVRSGHNTDQALSYKYTKWRDFFNARQLLCLGLLQRAILEIEDISIQEQMLCLFSSTLEFNNLFCSFKGEGTGAVRHMFSNHILKPERTPLENSVWGTSKSSGTFSTLFKSRLVKAKLYLDEPFEIALNKESTEKPISSKKIVASDPIRAPLVSTWNELCKSERGLMILNGDSSHLPLPDLCVDAVITDPPYFDFIHYSELSDFFFAWLSPVLKSRYAFFNRHDSSDSGEVQHKDPLVFAKQLGLVFTECTRVLKDDGVLAFSFHHSRPDGWASIYDAISSAGLIVVAAHPVHAELRTSSPKSSSNNPISLDAIIVCKKRLNQPEMQFDKKSIILKTDILANELQSAGMSISLADRFVIGASQMLISSSISMLSIETIKEHLEEFQLHLNSSNYSPTFI
ncbi:MAG: DNA methyltransferase [Methylotenera sp.]|nr:DNA methyltransferase [Methylotenera sp.]